MPRGGQARGSGHAVKGRSDEHTTFRPRRPDPSCPVSRDRGRGHIVSRVHCREHGGYVREEDAVVMGSTATGSGAPLPVYACVACVRDRGLVPPQPRAYTPPRPPAGFRR
jgi:hypothetical protein